MAMNLDAAKLFNPMLLWTDLGLRALEMTVNTSQNVSEGVDRFARAGASVEASEAAAGDTSVAGWAVSTPSATAMATDLQRSALDMTLRGWVQFMSTLGDLAAMGADMAGKGFVRPNGPLEVMRSSLMLPAGFGWTVMPGQTASRARRTSDSRRETHAETENIEHALASGEKRHRTAAGGRSKARSKTRRSRGS